jgi:hypothetical protein
VVQPKVKEKAHLVLKDKPEECLELLWRNHREQVVVMDWIYGLKSMKKILNGSDIETYAKHNQWEGSFEVPSAASVTTGGGGTTGEGDESATNAGIGEDRSA